MAHTLKIGILGPESTGKSTLGKQLSTLLGGIYIKEYARTYVREHPHYTYADVCHIAETNREEWRAAEGLSFFDTELIITRVWMDRVYQKHPEWMEPNPCPMDLYLLLMPDIEWQADPTRENGNQAVREELFDCYLNYIQATGRPYVIVRGRDEKRLTLALEAVRTFIEQQ